MPEYVGQGEITNLSFTSAFAIWKAEERLSAPRLMHRSIEKRDILLRILPQEGARSMGQVYPQKV